jgi:hypothetical protein
MNRPAKRWSLTLARHWARDWLPLAIVRDMSAVRSGSEHCGKGAMGYSLPSSQETSKMSHPIEQWSATFRENVNDERGPFATFPAGIPQYRQDPELFWEPFLKLRGTLTGSMTFDPRMLSDFRYRLVQAHEFIHALHFRFRESTYSTLRLYLAECLREGRLSKGPSI